METLTQYPEWFLTAFWAKVHKTDSCWYWVGSLNRKYGKGYGVFRGIAAHRVSWEIAYGDIPEGMYVCHHCDTRRCVRPDHLFLGTASDNFQDALRKGRIHQIALRIK